MKATLTFSVALMAALALLVATPAARAADDDVPSIKKRPDKKDKEKEWAAEIGTAIVKAARSGPAKIEMDSYKIEDVKDKKDKKDLKITMNWQGGITKKKFVSTIVVKIDVGEKDTWEVSNIDYSDDNKVSLTKPNAGKIQELIKKLNK